jgi:MoxR-like ATPase
MLHDSTFACYPTNGAVMNPDGFDVIAGRESRVRSLDDVRTLFKTLGNCCRAAVQGRDDVIALVLTALFADGHVLIEDHPGSGKTTLAKTLGKAIVREHGDETFVSCRRIQFTPDLLPSDVTGVTMFDTEIKAFVFRNGPIFANLVIADEINRTSPKVQAALLEAMAEKQVTVDNTTHPLESLFFVIATQNPFDLAGTYPLPRAQLDRFLFKITMTHLSREREIEVLTKWKAAQAQPLSFGIRPAEIVAARKIVSDAVRVPQVIYEGLADIAQALRHDKRVLLGISTRSLILAIPALQVWAMIHGRDYISPRDVKTLAAPIFGHRLELMPGEKEPDKVVADCIAPIIETMSRSTLSA